MDQRKSHRPRTPGLIFGVLSLVLVLLVAVMALTARTPPPPTIAEFAPQAVDNITDAPSDQSSSSGKGSGDCGAGQACGEGDGGTAVTPTPAPAIDVPRVRKCVGDPPRQIEDPQSPPCVPYYAGDNGGATSKGVTRDEIRIAAHNFDAGLHPAMERFFNKRFEFYGRQMRIKPITSIGGDAAGQQADAVQVDEQIDAFAAGVSEFTGSYDFYLELARRKIISAGTRPLLDKAILSEHAPYTWQYAMAVDKVFSFTGDWICTRLAGKPASHTQPPLSTQTREFGIILANESPNSSLTFDALTASLSRCGIKSKATFTYTSEQGTVDPGAATNASLQMRNENVTSVICLCHAGTVGTVASSASGQGYYPEWITTSYNVADLNSYIRTVGPRPEQRSHYFGITVMPRQVRPENTPMMAAFNEGGGNPGSPQKLGNNMTNYNVQYRSMLLLASGIQMAGPKLTPQTFSEGLHKTTFPNPETELNAGHVGFAGGSQAMTLDAAEYYWSEAAQSPYSDEGAGTLCYPRSGKRYAKWTSEPDLLFQLPCE